uniref:Uncharacterized protein n=1 Tax=Anguilla anguilla TaxID=7936 RepID=A0A0E9XFP4_ANGAN
MGMNEYKRKCSIYCQFFICVYYSFPK